MEIDRIVYPVKALGPGSRVALWTVGCSIRCAGCSNPELWNKSQGKNIDINLIYKMIAQIAEQKPVDGITISGGEPLDQAPELLDLLARLENLTDDVLIYTGYNLSEIPESVHLRLLPLVTCIVCGPYVDDLNDGKCALRGSNNQQIILTKDSAANRYDEYLAAGRRFQNLVWSDEIMSIGLHNKNAGM